MLLSYGAEPGFVNRKVEAGIKEWEPGKRKAPPGRGALGVEEGNFHESEIQTSTNPANWRGNPNASSK